MIKKIPSLGLESAVFHSLNNDMIINNAEAANATSSEIQRNQFKLITHKTYYCEYLDGKKLTANGTITASEYPYTHNVSIILTDTPLYLIINHKRTGTTPIYV